MNAATASPTYRHFVLSLSTLAAVGSSVVHLGTPFLIPALTASGLSLPAAGALFLAGCAAASVNSASGRVVSGWYPASQRGTAMGIRQMAQPLGAALSAVTLPVLASAYDIRSALFFAAALCAVLAVACLLCIKDPPRPASGSADHAAAAASPYRGSRYLVRIHVASAMLSWPQSMMGSFILVWLIARGYSEVSAGVIVMIAQLCGAGSRAAIGFISDRARSRLRPYRQVAMVTLGLLLLIALFDGLRTGWAAGSSADGPATSPAGVMATIIVGALAVAAVSPNGLAFTAVAEYAGPLWSGRALGTQNTFQNIVYAATPPLAGALITGAGFPALFVVSALFPAVALAVSPREDERRHGRHALLGR